MLSRILTLVLVLVCSAVVNAGPLKRLLLHDDQSIAEAIHKLDANIVKMNASFQTALANLNTSLQSEINGLKVALQAEQRERCQIGEGHFDKCHKNCTQNIDIHFNPQFSRTPSVLYALNAMDIDHLYNTRITTSIKSITTAGATLSVKTWADSRVYSTSLNWIACPK